MKDLQVSPQFPFFVALLEIGLLDSFSEVLGVKDVNEPSLPLS